MLYIKISGNVVFLWQYWNACCTHDFLASKREASWVHEDRGGRNILGREKKYKQSVQAENTEYKVGCGSIPAWVITN